MRKRRKCKRKKARKAPRSNKDKSPIILIDTREKKPYEIHPSKRVKLDTGDYSIEGLEHIVTVERKTKIDAYGTIGSNRDRFTRELERMRMIAYPAIIIECTQRSFLIPPSRSKLNPRAAMNSVLSWSVEYGVHVFFAGDRAVGLNTAARILHHAWRKRETLRLVFQQKALGTGSF